MSDKIEETGGKKTAKYGPTDKAKAKPIYLLKRQVAIGGDVTTRTGKVVKEATSDEYAELSKLGYAKLIKKIA